MKLAEVLADCPCELVTSKKSQAANRNSRDLLHAHGSIGDIDISAIAYDSRKVTDNGLFVAVRGGSSDGHDFIGDAIKRGAAAVVCEKKAPGNGLRATSKNSASQDSRDWSSGVNVSSPVTILVDDSRETLACVSNNFYHRPSEGLSVIGVTGTNGKTTTTYLIKSVLEAWGKGAGLIGTITYIIGDRHYTATHTTPESPEFQSLLAEMASAGCSHVVTEVSSHSLAQKRVDHTRFAVVVFTNLTRDHLDFHGTMEAYFVSKERLFTELLSRQGVAVINVDDEWGRRLGNDVGNVRGKGMGPSVVTYGLNEEADVSASDITASGSGISFVLKHGLASFRIDSPLVGMPNVYNLLAAASAGIALGVPTDVIRAGLAKVGLVKGRLETVEAGQDFLCIIDYAHTPDALERLLRTARELLDEARKAKDKAPKTENKIVVVFGCGGDRDRGKRPLMGEIAARLGDYVIITSDNPRSEDPEQIIKEVISGISNDNCHPISDRRNAIVRAVDMAGPGDVVVIAGKGHEDYQEIGGRRYKFSDREVAEEAIRNRLKSCETGGP